MAGTNQICARIICDLLVPILKTERPGCPWHKAGWNVQSEIDNRRSLLLIVDSNLVGVVISALPFNAPQV